MARRNRIPRPADTPHGTALAFLADRGLSTRDLRIVFALSADVDRDTWSMQDAAHVAGVTTRDVELAVRGLAKRARIQGRKPLFVAKRVQGRRVLLAKEGSELRFALWGVYTEPPEARPEPTLTAVVKARESQRQQEELARLDDARAEEERLRMERAALEDAAHRGAHALESVEVLTVDDHAMQSQALLDDAISLAEEDGAYDWPADVAPEGAIDVSALLAADVPGFGPRSAEALGAYAARHGDQIRPSDLEKIEGITTRVAAAVRAWHQKQDGAHD